MSDIDPVCSIHGRLMSEHDCLYCCRCFKYLTVEECNSRPDGTKEDVCTKCAEKEKLHYPKPMTFHAQQVKPVYIPSVRGLCTKPYHNHPKGCPNFGVRADCPPNVKLLPEIFNTTWSFWALWAEFDLAAHVSKMRTKHPLWTDPQLYCCLYWQGTVRKFLRENTQKWVANFSNGHNDVVYTEGPEAIGVDVTATMKQVGVQLEWPPKQIVRKIILLGVKK